MTLTGTPKMVITGTATMELFTSLTHLLGTTIQDGPGYGPDGVTTMMPGGMITTTGDTTPGQPLMRLENLVTPGSGGELTDMFTSTIITTMESTGLSTAIMILYTFMIHPTGDTIQDGTGSGLDITSNMMAVAKTSSLIPGTGGDTTWTGTLMMVITGIATMELFTSLTHLLGTIIQDGLGYGPDGVTTMMPGGMMTTTGDTTPGQPLMRLENSVTPGSGGELTEMFTSTIITTMESTGLSSAITILYTSMTHPTGDTIQDGPGYGPDGVTTMTPGGMMTTTGDT